MPSTLTELSINTAENLGQARAHIGAAMDNLRSAQTSGVTPEATHAIDLLEDAYRPLSDLLTQPMSLAAAAVLDGAGLLPTGGEGSTLPDDDPDQ